ncbi:MAG: hypothetical protein KJ634_00530 [Gammaproteobacteria bacterium]|nr:hypothetical protein [Gammaproteobacteria bacterium]MBU1414085.1 hypothetical protein [Gammaproteobacteria bacterium]
MALSKEAVVLYTAVVALLTGIVGLVASVMNAIRTQEYAQTINATAATVEEIKNCRGQVAVRIDSPSPVDSEVEQVSERVNVQGEGTVHQTCHYVLLLVHDVSVPGRPWTISDLVQINTTGRWAGIAQLHDVLIGGLAEIDARVVAQPSEFPVGNSYPYPIEAGVRSNIVRVRRIN